MPMPQTGRSGRLHLPARYDKNTYILANTQTKSNKKCCKSVGKVKNYKKSQKKPVSANGSAQCASRDSISSSRLSK